jgi:hypothetical protein
MIDLLNPQPAAGLDTLELPLVNATEESLRGYGRRVADPESEQIEIVTWPAPGWRPVDPGTGNEGGITTGIFNFWWQGDVLYGRNEAVDDDYLLGWSCPPEQASPQAPTAPRSRVLLWHANYHPDGGQLFHPLDGTPFVVPLALPGDDVSPKDFVAFYFDGSCGLYIHPGIWHEGVFPVAERARFDDRQGKVHARVSCDFTKEFGTYLDVPLRAP